MKVMVVSPHPDDETLGAGGFLLKCRQKDAKLYWLNVTNMKEEYGYSPEQIERRQNEIDQVKSSYGIKFFYDLALKPAGVDEYPLGELVGRLKEILDEARPDTLLIPYGNDVHSDHRVIYHAVYSCTKSFRSPYLKTVLCMEILSETDQASPNQTFTPNFFVNIADYIDKKIQIMKIYESELKEPPFPRNPEAIRGLSAFRGAAAGYPYGEAFYMLKHRIN